jgi:hypothetical protein
MRMFSRRFGFSGRGATIALAASMMVASPTLLVAAPEATTPSKSVGELAVASDPGGATVYVDGQFAGQTPLSLKRLKPGDHRVRVVKDGYLENARVVTVSPGKSSSLQIRLTVRNVSETLPEGQGGISGVSSGGGGSSSKKWLYVGLAGAGAATAVVLATRSHAPTVAQVTALPTSGLQSGTAFSFSAAASDEDGDSLTYNWSFGDGGTATGLTATHVYGIPGSFNATVTVSDGKKETSGSAGVTVRALTGTWNGVFFRVLNATITVTQTGSTFNGTYRDTLLGAGTVSAGTIGLLAPGIQAPGVVVFTVTLPGFTPFTFTGKITDANTLEGVVNGSDFVNEPWTLRRQ